MCHIVISTEGSNVVCHIVISTEGSNVVCHIFPLHMFCYTNCDLGDEVIGVVGENIA